nr:MAG TPA: YycJ-like MBL-fold protein [Caudoviricetes sp.]
MELQIIGTGSSGNAYLLRAGGSALLLDAGLPIRQLIRAVPDWKCLDGCLITHEHGDHAKSAEAVAQMGVKTYCSAGTAEAIRSDGCLTPLNAVQMLSAISVGEFTVLPFETQHDAAEPCGYLIRHDPTGEVSLYATDTYYLKHTFPGVHYWIVECNYIDEVIDGQQEDGELTAALWHRLKKSHMSLRRLLDALRANDLSKTRTIVLVHLSDERSDERAMVKAVKEVTGLEEVIAAAAGMTIPLELNPF